ncbi:MAG: hypothetical protein A2289_04390 [Deltaproteobacteria bacterium RIFOXYA12_FULL_58_15]|nr:MAG: hypothetical protein A2289_04390 [Deltaproteobacteria bacterium RIFOXYA12_FULL_58_15]
MNALQQIQQGHIDVETIRLAVEQCAGDAKELSQLRSTLLLLKVDIDVDIYVKVDVKLKDFLHCHDDKKHEKSSCRTATPSIETAIVEKHKERVDNVIAPAPYDPLYVAGKADPGAKISLTNPDIQGWPVIATTTADGNGEYSFKVEDPSKFEYGDRVLVSAQSKNKEMSQAVMRCTKPIEQVHVTRHHIQRGHIIRSEDGGSYVNVLIHGTDLRGPYLDASRLAVSWGRTAGDKSGFSLSIKADSKAVPPSGAEDGESTKIRVYTGNKLIAKVKADEYGRFDLTADSFRPGRHISIEVEDVHGQISKYDLATDHLHFDERALRDSVRRPLTQGTCAKSHVTDDKCVSQREVYGKPPYLVFSPDLCRRDDSVVTPKSSVAIRIIKAGEKECPAYQMTADGLGRLNAAVGPVKVFEDIVEMAVVDKEGDRGLQVRRYIVLPEPIDGSYLFPLDEVRQSAPNLESYLEAIKGSKNGTIELPTLEGLPPFGQLSFEHNKKRQVFRADAEGVLCGARLNTPVDSVDGAPAISKPVKVQLLGPSGRSLGVEYTWRFPECHNHQKVEGKLINSRAVSLGTLAHSIGEGKYALIDSPYNIDVSARCSKAPGGWGYSAAEEFEFHYGRHDYEARVDNPFPQGWQPQGRTFTMGEVALEVFNSEEGVRNVTVPGRDHLHLHIEVSSEGAIIDRGPSREISAKDIPQLTIMLEESLTLAAQAYSMGCGPKDRLYDSAMTAAKTILFAMDRAALREGNAPEWQNAVQNLLDKFAPYELCDNVDFVPPADAHGRQAAVDGTPTEVAKFWTSVDEFGKEPPQPPRFDFTKRPRHDDWLPFSRFK